MTFKQNPIKFGTDGWRGVIAADFTFERVIMLAPIAAQVLLNNYGTISNNHTIIVGYDRCFLAEEFAKAAADSLVEAGFSVALSQAYAPTPAFSWAVKSQNALGAIILTASHNPGKYLGVKIKGAFGGSVSSEITQQIENLLYSVPKFSKKLGTLSFFDPWKSYSQELKSKVDIEKIQKAIKNQKLTVFADVMYGAAANGLERLLECPIQEINSHRDPLFGGHAPEPLPCNLTELSTTVKKFNTGKNCSLSIGLVFDGDGDRIAAVDKQGNFLSSQVLLPILIDHLVIHKGLKGEIIKTVSSSDLISRLADLYNLPIFETPIGYKYIADRMLGGNVLIGGEESGGIGYGIHIPERDALLSALYLLEAIVQSGDDLGEYYLKLQKKVNFFNAYNRIDLPLSSFDMRSKLIKYLETKSFKKIANKNVLRCDKQDGYKYSLEDQSWLLIRFSGTEPILRLYCESLTLEKVSNILEWIKNWASSI